mmetsp:Transcript_12856/g.24449  ORF Transcript_12856/g.24449 Transcript_12856/m.24449 type:complete len:198 (+) Transcript_12856:436-1029(+)
MEGEMSAPIGASIPGSSMGFAMYGHAYHNGEVGVVHGEQAGPPPAMQAQPPPGPVEYAHTAEMGQMYQYDPYYGGVMYGQQMVGSQFSGLPQHQRMALPGDAVAVEEEPVYVNAKQYHCILRRRQQRAKLEAENKLVKVRKPYLHESRHAHAARRMRGPGGRFLTKAEKDALQKQLEEEEKANAGGSGQGTAGSAGH